jgi:hypothetical protein
MKSYYDQNDFMSHTRSSNSPVFRNRAEFYYKRSKDLTKLKEEGANGEMTAIFRELN